MKINRKELKSALAVLSKAVDKKCSRQYFQGVKVDAANDGYCTLAVANVDGIWVEAVIPCVGDARGFVNFTDLSNLVKAGKSKDVEITSVEATKDGSLNFEADGVKATLVFQPDFAEFPQTPIMLKAGGVEDILSVQSEELASRLAYVLPAMSTDETRPHLNQVLVSTKGDIVTTDGHRLHLAKVNREVKREIRIPRNTAMVVNAAVKADKKTTTMDYSSIGNVDHFQCRVGAFRITFRGGLSNFPAYDQVIPKDNNKSFSTDAERFGANVEKIVAVAKDKRISGAVLEIRDNDAWITYQNTVENISASYFLDVETTEVTETKIGVNARYLVDAVAGLKKADIEVAFHGALDPMVVTSAKCGTLAVIMPMRI